MVFVYYLLLLSGGPLKWQKNDLIEHSFSGKRTTEGFPIAREMLAILDLIYIAVTIFVAYD